MCERGSPTWPVDRTQRLHGQAKDAAGPAYAPGARSTPAVYHRRVQHIREAPRPRTGARREADVPHGTLNYPIDRHKGTRHVFFLVHEWLLQVEQPAERVYRLTNTQ